MKIIYVDSLFLLNFIIDYLLLIICARALSIRIARVRYLIAAAVGGGYAVLCFVPNFEFLITAPMKLVLWAAISLIAFGSEKYLLRCALSFFAISAAFGGGVWALTMFYSGTGSGFLHLDLRIMLLSFAICYFILSLVFSGKFSPQKKMILSITICHRGKSAEISALRDTGNLLKDSVSGKSVIVCSISDLRTLFTDDEVSALSKSDSTEALLELSNIPNAPRFYPILYRTVGLSSGFIPSFCPETLYIDGKVNLDYVLAVSPQNIGSEEYSAII